MTTAELKEYLGMVVQVEKEVDTQERLRQKLSCEENDCDEKIANITKVMGKIRKPHKPTHTQKNKEKAKNRICTGVVMLVIFVVMYFTATIMIEWHLDQNILADLFAIVAFVDAILGGTFLLTGIGAYLAAPGRDNQIYKDEVNKYREQSKVYETMQRDNQNRTEQIRRLENQKRVAEVYRQKVENSLATSKRNLEKMYSYNVIYPKYRNYVMVSSIYEYICAGRCTTLEGHEGAYNILELEIKLNHISTQLDRVIMNLEAIRANQYMLYSCLQESNREMNMLLQEESRIADSMQELGAQSYEMNRHLGELQHSSELANYLAECNNRQLSYMNRMNYLAGHYENPYGNYAPV